LILISFDIACKYSIRINPCDFERFSIRSNVRFSFYPQYVCVYLVIPVKKQFTITYAILFIYIYIYKYMLTYIKIYRPEERVPPTRLIRFFVGRFPEIRTNHANAIASVSVRSVKHSGCAAIIAHTVFLFHSPTTLPVSLASCSNSSWTRACVYIRLYIFDFPCR